MHKESVHAHIWRFDGQIHVITVTEVNKTGLDHAKKILGKKYKYLGVFPHYEMTDEALEKLRKITVVEGE